MANIALQPRTTAKRLASTAFSGNSPVKKSPAVNDNTSNVIQGQFRNQEVPKNLNNLAENIVPENSGVARALQAQQGMVQKPANDNISEEPLETTEPGQNLENSLQSEVPDSQTEDMGQDNDQSTESRQAPQHTKRQKKKKNWLMILAIIQYIFNLIIWSFGLVLTVLGFVVKGASYIPVVGIVATGANLIIQITGMILDVTAFIIGFICTVIIFIYSKKIGLVKRVSLFILDILTLGWLPIGIYMAWSQTKAKTKK